MKICIKEDEFNPSLLNQNWCNEEIATEMGYTIVEIEEKYNDCCFEDFNKDSTFNVDKYNNRKKNKLNNEKIYELKEKLKELTYDFIQAQAGAIVPELELKTNAFKECHNELRKLLGREPRLYS